MLVAISQRHEKNKHGDYVDSLENNYVDYFSKFGIRFMVIPNTCDADYYLDNFPIEGVIFSGGNDIVGYGDNASESRDATERKILDIAIERKLPVLGICRGMQFINIYFGGSLKKIDDHIRVNHKIKIDGIGLKKVNSYHGIGITKELLSSSLKAFAMYGEVIEGIYHPSLPIAGIEWHPERPSPDSEINEKIIKAFVDREIYWR
ncbi:MAG: gamma-glutamyl-gamma-aminobutyrate hydrolase family protein [Nanoarchaeota archaeon]|nr:gamma-glutamyl-gamma-aminobutyrate hydrolase family protein [Nanoarchaeota archaeon]MBU1704795.1 gamma-glutamyl-gamma-aminobutyrate hydrolase family protein [Nanoarchaeota archaeon]